MKTFRIVGKDGKFYPQYRILFWWLTLPEISLIEDSFVRSIKICITKNGTKFGYKAKDEAIDAIKDLVAFLKPKKIEFAHVVSGKSKHESIKYAIIKNTYICVDKRKCNEVRSPYIMQRTFIAKIWDDNESLFRNKVLESFEGDSVDYYSEKDFR